MNFIEIEIIYNIEFFINTEMIFLRFIKMTVLFIKCVVVRSKECLILLRLYQGQNGAHFGVLFKYYTP